MANLGRGAVISGLLALLAAGGVVAAFVSSSSPYVSIKEALANPGARVHLAGKIDPKTVRDDRLHGSLSFDLRDPAGDKIHVNHVGEPPANLGEATQVVVIGKLVGGEFVSEKMLVKCPSKYESDRTKPAAGV